MTAHDARRFAARAHGDAPDRYGVRLIDHVRRVAASVPGEARTVAWLHEVLECTPFSARELRAAGVNAHELAAIRLLTRDPGTDAAAYMAHIERIAEASGVAGRLARIVKRADLEDRLRDDDTGDPSRPRPAYRDALTRLDAVRASGDVELRRAERTLAIRVRCGGRG